jgi:hypothetical protein
LDWALAISDEPLKVQSKSQCQRRHDDLQIYGKWSAAAAALACIVAVADVLIDVG